LALWAFSVWLGGQSDTTPLLADTTRLTNASSSGIAF
jgi:hypothetical protein